MNQVISQRMVVNSLKIVSILFVVTFVPEHFFIYDTPRVFRNNYQKF